MAEVTISRETVDAASRAIYERSIEGYSITMPDWDAMPDEVKLNFRETALAALNVAAPHIAAAAYDSVKTEVENLAAQRDAIGDDDYEPDEDNGDCCSDAGECHRSGAMASYARVASLLANRAAELRAQS